MLQQSLVGLKQVFTSAAAAVICAIPEQTESLRMMTEKQALQDGDRVDENKRP